MVIYVTLDSSIIVAALREQEEKHEECKRLLGKVKDGSFIAKEIGVRGMDAIVVQTAKEFGSILISLDGEMVKRAKSVVAVKNGGDF